MNIIRKLSRKNIEFNKSWTIFTVLGIILATAMITAVFTFAFSFYRMMVNETIANVGSDQVGMNSVSVAGYQELKENETLEIVKVNDTTKYFQPSYPVEYETNWYSTMRNLPKDSSQIKVLFGRMPENSQEIMISSFLYDDIQGIQSLQVGDEIILNEDTQLTWKDVVDEDGNEYIDAALKTPSQASYTLVGIFDYPANLSSKFGGNVWTDAYTVGQPAISYDVIFNYKTLKRSIFTDAQKLFDQVKLFPNGAGASKTEIGEVFFNESYLQMMGISQNAYFMNTITVISGAAAVVLAMILAAGISLIRNSFALAASERVRELGIVSSVGATRKQKKWIIYNEGFFLALIGITLGVFSGYFGMMVTFNLMNQHFSVFASLNLEAYLPWLGVLGIVIFAFLTVFISMRGPAKTASKVSPIESIRRNNEFKVTKKSLHTSRATVKVFGIEGEIARKYMVRNRKRYRPTLISLSISIILFLVAMNFTGMMRQSLNIWDTNATDISTSVFVEDPDFDDYYQTLEDSGLFKQILLSQIFYMETTLPEEYTGYDIIGKSGDFYYLETGNYQVQMMFLNDEAYQIYLQENKITANQGFVLYDEYHEYIDGKLVIGQTTKLTGNETINLEFGGENVYPVTLNQRASTLPPGSYAMPLSPAITLVGSPEQLIQLEAYLENNNTYLSYGTSGLSIKLILNNPEDDQKAVSLLKSFDTIGEDGYIYNRVETNQNDQQIMTVLTIFVSGFIAMIALICLSNIINTMSNNIRQRRREFAILRSVGMTSKGINKMLYFESLMYGVKTLIVSIPVSVLLNWWIHDTLNQGTTLNYGIGPLYYVGVTVMVMVIVLIVMIYVSRKIKKENIIETIKDESI